MGKTANLELNTTEMSDKISDFVSEYNSNMNMLDDLYGDVQDDASSALSTAQSAETKATAAQTAATNAVTTANSANTTAQSAVSTANSANTTAGQANTKADNAVATANTAKDTADEAKETAETASADVADKADVDGTYDSFTAGGAKQLLSTVYVDDNEPYNFRTAGGSADIGDRMYEEVVGGSIVWNQLIHNGNFADGTTNWSKSSATISASNGIMTLTPSAQYGSASTQVKLVEGHVYMFAMDFYSTVAVRARVYASSKWFGVYYKDLPATTWYAWAEIARASSSSDVIGMIIQNNNSSDYGEQQIKNVVFIDFTAMFGSAIADYIMTLETATAGAGVAWFRKLFPKPYYEYNSGELMSVKAGSHDTVGFNQFDKSTAKTNHYANGTGVIVENSDFDCTDYIPCFPNTNYYTNCDVGGRIYKIVFFDASKSFVGTGESNAFTTPSTARYIVVNTAHSQMSIDDLVLNLAWDGERNGEYEPYEKHEYPLANIELRGIPKLDANNQLYYDGDTYASDGTVTRNVGTVDLGTLTWEKSSSDNKYYARIVPPYPANIIPSVILTQSDYVFDGEGSQARGYYGEEKTYRFWRRNDETNPSEMYIRDDRYSTVEDFTTAMSGVYLVYPLANPTTETADTFVNPQVVDDFGTEEYVDYAVEAGDRDVVIPVGHNSQYMNNLRAKLEMAPDSPSGDGKYIVQQSNGESAYVPYTADGRLDAIEAKLPAPPSANGTYKLTATVSNNGVTYSWQS